VNKGLTAKGAATRRRITAGAAALVRERGPAATSLDDVLAATATSKSQLFHYFPNGRHDLLLAVARYEADIVLEVQEPYLSDLTTVRKWQAWRAAVIAHYKELGDRCPLGSLTAQLGKTSPQARTIVGELFEKWETCLLAGVEAVASQGVLSPDVSAAEAAQGILAAVQGGVVMLQATGRISYLESALDVALAPLHVIRAAPVQVASS
jgi:AcrR family transcriptional regulator